MAKAENCPSDEVVREEAKFFESAYKGFAPWDIGRPQKAMVELEDSGEIEGAVLDVGCGTGENALMLASRGHEVWGIDIVPEAIKRAKQKAKERRIEATFTVLSAFKLGDLKMKFNTVIDCGMFHALDDDERICFKDNLKEVLVPGGRYHMLCFSEKAPAGGPRRLSKAEIRSVFGDGLEVLRIKESYFETKLEKELVPAWLASIVRT